MSPPDDQMGARHAGRRARYRRGLQAERIGALRLRLSGGHILARRYKTTVGEIDLIVRHGRRIGFVEVKARRDFAACEAAISQATRARVRRAADIWLAGQPKFAGFDVGFDLLFIVPWRWPRWLPDHL